jgi:hypothetical protein
LLGHVEILTKRAADGIAECEHALKLDPNLAHAHATIGLGKIYVGRAQETEAHIGEALRLSPRDAMAYLWMSWAGIAKNYLGSTSKRSRGFGGRSRPTEIIRIHILCWASRSRCLVDWTRRVPRSKPV